MKSLFAARRVVDLSLPSLTTAIVSAGLLLAPLLLLPVFTNFTITSKLLLINSMGIGLVGIGLAGVLGKRILTIHRSPIITFSLLFGLAVAASSVINNRYPAEHLLGMGGALLSMATIVVVASSWLRTKTTQRFSVVWYTTLILAGIITLLQALGWGPSQLINALLPLNLPNTGILSLTGSLFFAAQLGLVGLLSSIVGIIKEQKSKALAFFAALFSAVTLIMSGWYILPGQATAPLILPIGPSWTIAVEMLKVPRTALVGVGPENYQLAYQLYRPSSINAQTWWDTTFSQGFNVPLTLLTTTGLVGLLSWCLLAYFSVKLCREQWPTSPVIATVVASTFLLQLVTPLNYVILIIQAVSLAWLLANSQPRRQLLVHLFKVLEEVAHQPSRAGISFWKMGSSVLIGLVLVFLYGNLSLAYLASYQFFRSSLEAQQNDLNGAYQAQVLAAQINPFMSLYQSSLAISNMQIATAIASSSETISEEQQTQASNLVQEAIERARLLTVLRPDDSESYRVLATIYRAVVPFTGEENQTAVQWTVASFVEAINRSPVDPILRIQLGQFLLESKQYPDAVLVFQQAAQLKPDFAASYYYLAQAFRANSQLENAQASYEEALRLTPTDSEEYEIIAAELDTVKKELSTQEPATKAENQPLRSGTSESTATESASSSALPNLPSLIEQNLPESAPAEVGDIQPSP